MSLLPTQDLLEATANLCRQAGKANPTALEPLAGGKNNRVFRVSLEDGSPLILKSYFFDPRDPRDRLRAEWDFVAYAWTRGVREIPEPLDRDEDRHLGLFAFAPGRRLDASEICEMHLCKAADFIVAVNQAPRRTSDLAPGSEACFSIRQHVETVARRVACLLPLEPSIPDHDSVHRFVTGRLLPAWEGIKTRLQPDCTAFCTDPIEEIDSASIIASPSDFGFHNALFDPASEALTFIDFEYAGRDDPAKLVCDFFCQPEVPIEIKHFSGFVDRVMKGLGLPDIHRARCRLLLDLYRIKWAAIILNQFTPLGATRRAFASHDADSGAQLCRAERQLACLGMDGSEVS